MAEIQAIEAEARDRVGKGSSRAASRSGKVPAVIYGEGQEPIAITLPNNVLVKQLKSGQFLSSLFDVNVGGDTVRVIPRDVQYDVVKDFPIHVDFLRVSKDTKVAVEVVVQFINEEEAPGIKRGGVLNVVRYEVELLCPVDNIPEFLEADLEGLDIGDSVHISDIDLPEGVEPTITDRDFTVATIAAPSGGAGDDEEEDAEGEEGEGEEAEGEEAAAEGDEGGEE